MKILLISDTHGDVTKVMMILERIKDIDRIIHCGDYQSDAWMLEDATGIPVTSVKGNCDGRGSDRQVLETPAGKLLITHGHIEAVGFTYNNLIYAAEEEGDCAAVCFGHTHVPFCEDFDGLWLVNPGSLTDPRGGSAPSYAILRCEDGLFHATLADFDTLIQTSPAPQPEDQEENSESAAGAGKSQKKKKTKGGFLRNLLNYSDRF